MSETVVIHIRISKEIKRAIDARAVKERRKSTDVVRMVLEDALLPREEIPVSDRTPEEIEQFLYPRGRLNPATTLIDSPKSYNTQAGE